MDSTRHALALNVERVAPALGPQLRLEPPFQRTREQHGRSAGEFTLFGLTHVFDLVRDVFDVEMRETAFAQRCAWSCAHCTTSFCGVIL